MREWLWREDKEELRLRGPQWDLNNHQKCHVFKKFTIEYVSPELPTLARNPFIIQCNGPLDASENKFCSSFKCCYGGRKKPNNYVPTWKKGN